MITAQKSRTAFKLQILHKELYRVPCHYFGRTIPCSGPGCPACEFRMPRDCWFAWVRSPGETGLIEMPPSLVACLVEAKGRCHALDYQGLIVELTRPSKRKEWRLVNAEVRQLTATAADGRKVAEAVATLFRLPGPQPAESFWGWLSRVRPSQATALKAAFLF